MRTLARAGRVTYVARNTFISMHVAYHESIAAPAPASVAEDMPESKEEQHAVVTLRTEFLDVQAKHAVAPIAFRETQRDFKRYAAVIAATSVEDVKVGDGEAFKDRKTSLFYALDPARGTRPQADRSESLTLSTLTLRIYEPARNGGLFLVGGNSDIQKVSSTL